MSIALQEHTKTRNSSSFELEYSNANKKWNALKSGKLLKCGNVQLSFHWQIQPNGTVFRRLVVDLLNGGKTPDEYQLRIPGDGLL
jgi:hypothetical protein